MNFKMLNGSEEAEEIATLFPFMGETYYDISESWSGLIREFCNEVNRVCQSYKVNANSIKIETIDEKYGEMRIFYDIDDKNFENVERRNNFLKAIDDIIDCYCDISTTVCQICGNAGEEKEISGWIYILCNECHEKYKK